MTGSQNVPEAKPSTLQRTGRTTVNRARYVTRDAAEAACQTLRRCLGCGADHAYNADGTPDGGALPCGN